MNITNIDFYQDIKPLLQNAKNRVYQTINQAMTQTYWQIGKRIVEEEQGGQQRAEYGKAFPSRFTAPETMQKLKNSWGWGL